METCEGMRALKNGIITILADDRKAIDIKITNAFPMISLEPIVWLITPSGDKRELRGFQHFSIPPDLRIHFTKSKKGTLQAEHIFFGVPEIKMLVGCAFKSSRLLFTYIGCPIQYCKELSGTWEGGAIIVSPFPDSNYDVNVTRVFVDFFVHYEPDITPIVNAPLVMKDMRLAYDRRGCVVGPFVYQSIQRRKKVQDSFLSSIRYGYINMAIDQSCYLYVPYEIRQ